MAGLKKPNGQVVQFTGVYIIIPVKDDDNVSLTSLTGQLFPVKDGQ